MQQKKVILWDHDGVLVDTEKWYYRSSKKVLAKIGIDLGFEQYMGFMQTGKSVWDLAREKGFSEMEIKQYVQERNQQYQHYLVTEDIEITNVEKVLAHLSTKYLMAIVTTARREDFELIHKNRSIVDYMDFVLTVEDYPKAKPEPDPYLTALKKYGVQKEEAIVVEDSARGLRSALAAGIDCVVVKNEFTASHDFSGAMLRIDSLEELMRIL